MFSRYSYTSTLTFSSNGFARSLSGSSTLIDGKFRLQGQYNAGNLTSNTNVRYSLVLDIANLSGPGTYVCKAGTGNELYYAEIRNTRGGTGPYRSQHEGSEITVVIAELNQTTGAISGTFSGTVFTETRASTKLTNGQFKASYR